MVKDDGLAAGKGVVVSDDLDIARAHAMMLLDGGHPVLLAFLQSSYEAAAEAAKWDRDALECALGKPGVVRQI